MIGAMLFMPLRVPEAIDAGYFELGVKTAEKGQPLEALARKNQVPIGLWFDGNKRRTSEFVLWLSPGYVSSILGYQKQHSGWSEEIADQRWLRYRAFAGTRTYFVARLVSLEKQDPLELADNNRPNTNGLQHIAFSARLGSQSIPIEVQSKFEDFSRHPLDILSRPWLGYFKELSMLAPLGTEEPDYAIPLGDNRTTTYLLSADIPDAFAGQSITISILSAAKPRKAVIRLIRG